VSHKDGSTYSATGTDADGDAISYTWAVDGVPVPNALGATFTAPPLAVGTHNITVTLLAGSLSLTHRWVVTSTNVAPEVGASEPPGGKGRDTGAAQSFQVTATDTDGDTLSYAWAVDGVARVGSGAKLDLAAGLAPGLHTVTVTVTDGQGGTTTSSWTFTVPTEAATGGGLGGMLPIILLVLAAAGGGAAFMVMRRKRGGGPGGEPPSAPPESP
jgi:hypothetical protein